MGGSDTYAPKALQKNSNETDLYAIIRKEKTSLSGFVL